MYPLQSLTDEQRAIYEWQIWSPDFGEQGQQRLSAATVLVSRVGGVGGAVAYQLAAAGIGRIVLAHAGNVRPSDLNRQILMTHEGLGTSRVESARRRLQELNPRCEVVTFAENIGESNVDRISTGVDVIVDCCPLFEERFVLNDCAIRRGIPLVECAMYDLEGSTFTVQPGRSACVRCLYPEKPPQWRRQFPVFGAVASAVGSLGAMAAIQLLAGVSDANVGHMVRIDLRTWCMQRFQLHRDPKCAACGNLSPPGDSV